jgi:hypothetical protein
MLSPTGSLESDYREWNDGLFTHILRKIVDDVRGESGKLHWNVFDGDVDPEWVEDLNRLVRLNILSTPDLNPFIHCMAHQGPVHRDRGAGNPRVDP